MRWKHGVCGALRPGAGKLGRVGAFECRAPDGPGAVLGLPPREVVVCAVALGRESGEPRSIGPDAGVFASAGAVHASIEAHFLLVCYQGFELRVLPHEAVGRVLDTPTNAAAGKRGARSAHEVHKVVRAANSGAVSGPERGKASYVVLVA